MLFVSALLKIKKNQSTFMSEPPSIKSALITLSLSAVIHHLTGVCRVRSLSLSSHDEGAPVGPGPGAPGVGRH